VDITIDHRHPRTQKARIRYRVTKKIRLACIVVGCILFVSGILLVSAGLSVGWFVASLFVAPEMVVLWYNGELLHLAPSRNPHSLDDVLEADLLGTISEQPSPIEIAELISETNDSYFLGARFGLTGNFIKQIASDEKEGGLDLLGAAYAISQELGRSQFGTLEIVAAIVRALPNHDALLAHLHIDESDIIAGIRWRYRLHYLIDSQSSVRKSGGIARDWSFGYTPLLGRFGQNISQHVGGSLFVVETDAHAKALDQMIATFSRGGRQNVALIGPTGVGKTTLVQAFAEAIMDGSSSVPQDLKFHQVVMLDASALISAAPGRGELEQLIMRIFGEAYAAKNIILCLDNAQVFFEDGIGAVDISTVLLPILEAGRLRIILAMDEQRFLQITARSAAIANALNRVSISPASEQETLQVMQDQLISIEFRHHVTFTYQALKEAYRLSMRYVHDVSMPGQALKLLESSSSYAENGLVTINSVQQAIEQTMDIKVSVVSEVGERAKLLQLEDLIHKRMINQTRAVSVVSDALRRARAGVRNENRPIGTFLFLGPTGVGKTELAKALADVYFGGEDRIIRLDLNEYVRSEDVTRLIADGSNDPSSLTAQVMKKPYSVVLLDEIEKAHPSVLTTLLQLLDEGILRDINNREVSFLDAIVIATSNAGADRIREYIQRGYDVAQFEEQFTNELIETGQFRPEFLNRFDEMVMFTPLTKADLLKVVDLMIAGVNKTLALQKITVEVEQEAKLLLVDKGYDPRLGARPMRRVIQRVIENNVAKAILAGAVAAGGVVHISASQVAQNYATTAEANDIASGRAA